MRHLRVSLVWLMAVVAIVALDIAVMRSLLRDAPGSNQTLYLVPVDGTHSITFAGLALGVLPMASLLVVTAIFQLPRIRRTGSVSAFWLGFEIFGWFSVFLFMIISSFSAAAIHNYLIVIGGLVASGMFGWMDNAPIPWLNYVVEFALGTLLLVLPELLVALAAGWLLERACTGIVNVRVAGETPAPPRGSGDPDAA